MQGKVILKGSAENWDAQAAMRCLQGPTARSYTDDGILNRNNKQQHQGKATVHAHDYV